MAFKLTKRIEVEGYGSDNWLELRPVLMSEYKGLFDEAKKLEDDPTANVNFIAKQIAGRLSDGMVGGEKVTPENVMDLPGDVFIQVFKVLMGEPGPK